METYCFSCKKNTAKTNFSATRINQNRLILVSIVLLVVWKKSRFIKNQEASRLLSKLAIRSPLKGIVRNLLK